jgi:hypothetical protein
VTHFLSRLWPLARVLDQQPIELGQALLTLQLSALQCQPGHVVVLIDQAPLLRPDYRVEGSERDPPELLGVEPELAPLP